MPLLAFTATIYINTKGLEPIPLHISFSVVYLCLILLSNTRIAWGMLASATVNLVAAAYYLSDFYLSNDILYYAILMTVVNLCILLTIVKGIKNGELAALDNIVAFRVLDLCHFQIFTTAFKRR